MFASKVTKDVTLTSDPTIVVTIKKLSWTQKESARRASQVKSAKALVDMGGAAFMQTMKELNQNPDAKKEPAAEDKFQTHDPMTVLVCGIKSWPFPDPVSKESIEQLDEIDVEPLCRAILELSYPPRDEADTKNAA